MLESTPSHLLKLVLFIHDIRHVMSLKTFKVSQHKIFDQELESRQGWFSVHSPKRQL